MNKDTYTMQEEKMISLIAPSHPEQIQKRVTNKIITNKTSSIQKIQNGVKNVEDLYINFKHDVFCHIITRLRDSQVHSTMHRLTISSRVTL